MASSQSPPQAEEMRASSPSSALSILNPHPQRLPGPSFLHQLVRDASPRPVTAIDYQAPGGSRRTVSYSEFHSQAERLAVRILAALSGHRLGKQEQLVVPVLLPQCPELYISQLAVLKVGGAFCPLNLDAPPERVRFIFGDVSARVVITSQAFRSKLDALGSDVTVLMVDQEHDAQDCQGSNEYLSRDIKPDSLAYVMYTSGSTGTPKGVGISHDAATQALLAHDRHIPHFTRFLQFAAPTFDVSVFEIFFPFLRGVTLVSCDRADMLNDLPAVLRRLEVDACELTPTVAGSLLRSRDNAPDLRLLLTIGEMLTVPVIREFGGDSDRPSILWAMYGPTEATIHCTLQPSCESSSSPNSVGFPLDTVSAFILEPAQDDGSGEFRVLPVGEMGELAVGGHQTAVGYINRPEQTAKVFIDSPYGRLYRTGDKARVRDNGTLECFGRISDGQVKLRGQRIELGEIEQAVLRTPGCRGAAAAVIEGIIIVFCETDQQDGDTSDQVLRTCQEWLPAFMVPGDVVLVEAFPRLPSGKVDRKGLKSGYETSRREGVEVSDEFQDDVERHLAQLVEEALGVRLKSSSTLSAAGIDSLAAIKLASRFRSAGFLVSALDVLGSKTISQLRSTIQREEQAALNASIAESRHGEDPGQVSNAALNLGVEVNTIEAVLPCAPMQISMLAETLKSPEAYCNWIEVQVPARYTPEEIATWCRALARHNEVLRTGFAVLGGRFKQVVWKDLGSSLIRTVGSLTRRYQLTEQELIKPFSVQILSPGSLKHRSVLLQTHHALYDGWSFDALLSDLNLLAYGEQPVKRPPFRLVSRYYNSSDFMHSADVARGYWAEYLVGYQPTPMPQLLAKHIKSAEVLSAQRTLGVETSNVLEVSSRLDVSPQVLFQACLLWLWGSILGTDDVVVGNITSGRTIPVEGIEDVVGPCLASIPLRAKLGQVRTIKELLESVHAMNRESLAHCTLPLSEIKKAAGIAPGQPLYDALFVYQESIPSRSTRKRPHEVQQVAHEDYLETKLLAEIEPTDKGFQLRVTCHSDVFHHGYMQLLLRQFESILSHILQNVTSDIRTIAGCFYDDLLSTHNGTPKTLDGCPDIATLFEKAATKQPEKNAICFAEAISDGGADLRTISYGGLNGLANRIARNLKASGAMEARPVAIIMEKSVLLYAGILGILKAGCAYLPLLPSTPKSRIQMILGQAGVELCVSDDICETDLPELHDCRFINLRSANLKGYSSENLGTAVDPLRIANIIYTSGSTGVPKGVCVTQLNICSNLDVLSRIYPVRPESRMLQACSQAFDVSVFEILFALTRGMCLCAAINDTLFADLERSINSMDVTHLSMTPTVASLVDPVNVPKVEFLVTSGEPMTAEVAKKWVGKLYQGYGPSETTNICSVKKMTPEDHIRHLGHTFQNTSAFVLVPNTLDIVPIGCVGELCFGGDQVVAGYLNLPDTTKEKFISHPKFGRIYRSGDMGRMLADGSLLIVGRIDDQIKLRGQRIELGEINNVVAASDGVSNCVTMLVNQGDDGAQQLACFYVLSTAESGSFRLLPAGGSVAERNESVFNDLRSRLPSYMVPSYIIPISGIPMTSSGKVDKAKLRDVFSNLGPRELEALSASSESAGADGDWSEEERRIASVVAAVLNVSRLDIGRWTPLTSLGLDSISAISVAKGLQKSFSRRIPISAILQSTSVARLATLLSTGRTEAVADDTQLNVFSPDLVECVRQQMSSKGHEVDAVLPCTPLQEAMLAASVGGGSYLNKMLLRLLIDSNVMKRCWSSMFRRHGILRTCFFSTDDREHAMAQCVLKEWEPEWTNLDVADGSLDDAIHKHAEAVAPAIDSGVPPISLAVLREGKSEYLSFICHHAMYDGVAISRLLEEVEVVASGAPLRPAPSYEPFLREALALPESTDDFWRRHLNKMRPMSLPRSAETQSGRDVLDRALQIPLHDIDASLKALNVSMLSLLQASWSTLLRIILDSNDVCFGNVVNGRSGTADRVEELVGPCFNTIPTRIDFQEKRRNVDILRFFQSLNPELLQFQFTPLRRIQGLVSTQGSRLFDTLLLLQQAPRPLDENLWTLERDDGEMDFPLVCEVTPNTGRDELQVKLHFDRSYVFDTHASFVYDTLSHIFSTFLRYPSSHSISKSSLPLALQERLGSLDLNHTTDIYEDLPHQTESGQCWSKSEEIIRSVLSTISRTRKDKINRHTTIFRLGLDSINAVQVAAMLRKEGISSITATDVLENPTCSKLASTLAHAQPKNEESPLYDLAGFQQKARTLLQDSVSDWDTVEAVLPCTALQMGLLTEFMNSKGKDYLNFISFRFEPGVTAPGLQNAWVQIVKAHGMLRTGFTHVDHGDSSFVMLQYRFAEELKPVHPRNGANNFDLSTWQDEAARAVFDDLRRPPWRVVLVDGSSGVEMHVAIHHVIYDAHSLHNILSDLSKVVRGETLASETDLSTVVQDVLTQTHRCKKTAQGFWEKQASMLTINKFPVMTSLREETRHILVQSRQSSLSFPALEQAVKNAGFTIQAVAQAAWLRILSSYLGEPAVAFGTILSGRNSGTTRDAVFPCITTLPIIAQNTSSNRQLVQAMMDYNTGLQRHQWTPLTDIQRWLGHPTTKLFDTLLVYQRFERQGEQARPWQVIDEQATVDYPVSLEIEPQEDTVELRLTFFSDVLPPEQAQILLRQFDATFCDLAEAADGNENDVLRRHRELFAVIPAEEPELKSDITFLHEFVEASAQAQPDETALEFVFRFENDNPASKRWAYRDLDVNGNKVANMLAPHVSTGDIVAVCFDKCPEAHFAILGILKAGCALLALDPGAPSCRKEFILQDSGAAVLLTNKAWSLGMGFDVSVPVVIVEEEGLASASPATPQLTRPLTSQDRSYCLYTSGTTGTPKGCEITHENAVQAMLAFQKLFEGHWDQDSKWLQFASYHFDVSVLEQYWTWSVGITLVAAPRDVVLEDLAGTISRLGITHIDLTPSLARLIHPDECPSLCRGVFITGGEQLKQEILDSWGPERVIHNFYGPTEATIGVTSFPCVPINGRSSNIGRQFPNVGSYVLRPGTDIPVLKGGVGELCVSGKLVGKGYLNRDSLTAERFPTLEAFDERVYRTGDLVRVLHDGCFDFLGRADDQVKLRGQRLEVGEINHCIRSGVSEIIDVATLVVRNEKQRKDLLVSFVVATRDEKSKDLRVIVGEAAAKISQQVQRACRERLPGYMVPTYVLLLPFIPLSPNNKAEFKELRALFNTLSPEQLVTTSPILNIDFDDFGERTRKALSNMAGVPEDNILPTTNIFELGVDSITVMRLAMALKREGIKHVTPAAILRNPTVADLIEALRCTQTATESSTGVLEARQAVEACQHRHRGSVCRELGETPENIEYVAPCSALQQGMISRSQTEGSKGAYFNTFRFELAEDVSLSKLRAAWEALVVAHSVLRTRFVSTTEGHVQVAVKSIEMPWNELKTQECDDLEALLLGCRMSWVETNSGNVESPLEFLEISHDETRLLVVHIFHAIYDANSFDLMLDEVARLYTDKGKSLQPPSFLDALLHGPLKNYSSSRAVWTKHLKGVRLSPMPRISEAPSHTHISVSRHVPFGALENVRKALGTTQQAIVQALWGTVLQRYFPPSGVTFGIIVSGRSIDLENVGETIGPLFNTIPYHHRVSQGQTWSAAIRECHDFNTAILPYQHVPLRDVQKWCSGGKPLFDTLFSFQVASAPSKAAQGLWKEVGSNVDPDYPLAFEAMLLPSGALQVLLVAPARVADEAALDELLDNFEDIARAVVNDPQGVVSTAAGGVVASNVEQDGEIEAGTTVHRTSSDAIPSFEWTPQAKIIRGEMALLSDVEESSISPNTSLLELGLDSIDTIKLSARLRRAEISLSNSDLIKGQTIARFVVVLQGKEATQIDARDSGYSSDAEDQSVSLRKHLWATGQDLANVQGVLPPTPLQDSMVSEMIDSEFQRYFNHDVLQISPDTDMARLRGAWETVIKNSPILRTAFVEVESPNFEFTHAQLIMGDLLPEIGEVEIKSLGETSLLMDQARERARASRGQADLLQITFAKLKGQTYVVLSIAHALYDGWSLGLLHQDVEAAYRGTYAPRGAYSGYLWDVVRSSGDDTREFWSDYVSDAAPTMFPRSHEPTVAGSDTNRAEAAVGIPATDLRAFCRRHAVSQQAVAQACWAAVLATRCRALDVTFGVVLSGRDTEAAEEMLFPTMNTVPVRAVLHGSALGFLRYVQDNVARVSRFQHFPLRKIQAMARDRQGGLFNTLFILQKGSAGSASPDEAREPFVKSVEGSSAVDYPICVEMEVEGQRIIWRTACDGEYSSPDETKHLLGELEDVLGFLINSSEGEILKFGNDGVSVCGLSSFQPAESQSPAQSEEYGEGGDEEWSPTELAIRAVLAEVSGVEQASISKSHNIYHLGLDSISAIKVSSALRRRGVAVSARDMTQATSIRDAAAKASESSPPVAVTTGGDPPSVVDAIPRDVVNEDVLLQSASINVAEVEEVLPATAMQTHMLSVWQNTNGEVYYPEFRYRLSGITGHGVVDGAWRRLVEQHAILRTVFVATGSKKVPFLQLALRHDAATRNPFVAFSIQRQDDSSWSISLRIHHALYDAVSLPLILDHFKKLLLLQGTPSGRGEDQSLSAWKKLVGSPLSEQATKARRSFWGDYLQGVRSSPLRMSSSVTQAPNGPTSLKGRLLSKLSRHLRRNLPRLAERMKKGDVGLRAVATDTILTQTASERVNFLRRGALANTTSLKALCSENGVGIQSVFLAAYAKVLASLSGRTDRDVVFGVYLANRGSGGPQLAYPTLSLVPLRVRVRAPPCEGFRIAEWAAGIQRDLHRISAPENVSVGLWEVKEWAGVEVDSFVNFLSLPDEPGRDDDGGPRGRCAIRLDAVEPEEMVAPRGEKSTVESPEQLAWLEKNAVRNAYPDAVDIEASLQASGAMDVGVFGSRGKLGDNSAEDLVDKLVEVLSI